MTSEIVIPENRIINRIYLIRGTEVMLDSELAEMYGVLTKDLNASVKRNRERFPSNFMFQLSKSEWKSMRLKFLTSKQGRGGRRYDPYVFTEHGILMLSSVLHSERAIEINISIMRTFVKLRKWMSSNQDLYELLKKLDDKDRDQDKKILSLIRKVDILFDDIEGRKIGFDLG